MSATSLGPHALADAVGVSTDTLRHYERLGLLPGVERTASGYRRYPAGAIERVLLIQRALVVGFSLADLTRVLAERDRGGAPCQKVRTLVGERLDTLNARIVELQTLRDELTELMRDWDARLASAGPGKPVRLLDTLGGRASVERGRRRSQGGASGRRFRRS